MTNNETAGDLLSDAGCPKAGCDASVVRVTNSDGTPSSEEEYECASGHVWSEDKTHLFCSASVGDLTCRREPGHEGKHESTAFEDDDHFNLQLVHWWSIKPNGDPVNDVEEGEDD